MRTLLHIIPCCAALLAALLGLKNRCVPHHALRAGLQVDSALLKARLRAVVQVEGSVVTASPVGLGQVGVRREASPCTARSVPVGLGACGQPVYDCSHKGAGGDTARF
jgi:hypothetical protein